MSWQRRLLELAAAGGALTSLAGCPAVIPGGCGNANPDPCICDRMPATSAQCVAEKTCEDNGGSWDLYVATPLPDAGSGSGEPIQGQCVGYPRDAGPDARPPDALVLDASPADAPQ